MLQEFSKRQEQHVNAVCLHQYYPTNYQYLTSSKANALPSFLLSADGPVPLSLQHPSDEEHTERLVMEPSITNWHRYQDPTPTHTVTPKL